MNILELTKAVRQNHALEHATMHILTWRHPYTRLMGRSSPSGFYIYGPVTTEAVADAAGEAHLAVHPRCGTNLVVTSTLVGTAAFVATLGRPRNKLDRLPVALMAATA